ncbi:DUF4232 domain-containing protein [Arthrobacter sp. B3I4]|uniref:DUF4232 domain-containing protein n=1 Tax=Arthrobacter sp. B3I4 TaxID=3042267 RepID=UPI00278AA7B9|nr:DUF4232 domain-containing protein [Arthrobacter sp. B3I4]MDQ0754309.1 hypothetical protein [Arthrobacter sp. B3I4]
MRPQQKKHRLVITSVTAAAAAALLLSGCAQSQPQAAASPAPASSSSPTSSSPSQSSQPSSASPSQTGSGAAAVATSPAPAGPALCKAANLTGSLDATGGGAAGSVYMKLMLTNSGAEPCLLKGFAGVSLTANATGEPIGAAASRDDSTPVADVLLAPGKAGSAVLRYTQAGNYQGCTRTPAAGFRVYPPEDTASLFVAAPKDACTEPGIHLLTIGAFTAV